MNTASTAGIVPLAGLVLLGACGRESSAPPAPVASIEVTPGATGVVIGQTLQLTAKLKDASGNELTGRQITWTSSAPARVTVSSTGMVTGVALADSVVITVTSEGKHGGAAVTVVNDISGEWNFTELLDIAFRVVGGPNNGVVAYVPCSDTGSYQFTQSGAEIAGTKAQVGTCLGDPGPFVQYGSGDNSAWPFPIVDGHLSSMRIRIGVGSSGCVYEGGVTGPPTPKLSGTYSCPNGNKGNWEATKGGAPVATLAVRWDAGTVVGGAVQLLAVPRDATGHLLSRAATWSSDNSALATVSDNGLVTVRVAGSPRISATSGATSGSATVTVQQVSFGSVSGGGPYSCAVTATQAAYCWGWGGDGQLGTGFRPLSLEPLASAETPLAVSGGHSFAQVSAGVFHSCGVTPTHEAYCWGDNSYGQLGDGSTTNSLVPIPVTGGHQFVSITVGLFHSCGVTTASEAYCWGYNESGQLGDGSTADRAVPALVGGGAFLFQVVRAGLYHTCAVTLAYEAYCWGYNYDGQVGNGTTAFAVSSPAAVAGGHSFVAVVAGFSHSCALSSDGAAYCWGNGGLLGDGSGQNQLAPVQVAGGLFAAADGALAAGQRHTCALTPSGAAYCWGHNTLGELGDGSTIDRSTPVLVSGGLSFATISVGYFHTCGVTSGAAAFCWGDNGNGQLGADSPASCVIDSDGNTLPCARAPVRVIGQPGAGVARSLREVTGPWQATNAESIAGPGLQLPKVRQP